MATSCPAGRPRWPEALYGGWIWAYTSGACFVVAGVAIAANRRATVAAFSIAVLVFAWAVTRNLPLALADASFGSAWTRLGKAVALSGGALAVAASARQGDQRGMAALTLVGRCALGVFLINSGVQHFLFHPRRDHTDPHVDSWSAVVGVHDRCRPCRGRRRSHRPSDDAQRQRQRRSHAVHLGMHPSHPTRPPGHARESAQRAGPPSSKPLRAFAGIALVLSAAIEAAIGSPDPCRPETANSRING